MCDPVSGRAAALVPREGERPRRPPGPLTKNPPTPNPNPYSPQPEKKARPTNHLANGRPCAPKDRPANRRGAAKARPTIRPTKKKARPTITTMACAVHKVTSAHMDTWGGGGASGHLGCREQMALYLRPAPRGRSDVIF